MKFKQKCNLNYVLSKKFYFNVQFRKIQIFKK